jgi:orotidine-5'-phosphate decarboxylase
MSVIPLKRAEAAAADPRLIVALDLPSRERAQAIVDQLDDAARFYKIGLELLASGGMDLALALKRRGRAVFLDWKLHDIGATVERATAAIAQSGAGDLLTVHGEPQVMAAAVRGRGAAPIKLLAVTVLTSLDDDALAQIGYAPDVRALVERRIRQAVDLGLDGVIVSPREAALARRIGGDAPAEALKAGASHLVVGRPITAADDPRAAALAIAAEMAGL